MTKAAAILLREVREALPAFLFFFVAFHMIAITKTVILEGYAISTTSAAVATVGALIVAKAVLLVEKLPFARNFSGRAIYGIFWKALLFALVATLFRVLEELIHAWVKQGSILIGARDLLADMSWPHFFVIEMWLLALLLLYCLAAHLVRVIGVERVWKMLTERDPTAHNGQVGN